MKVYELRDKLASIPGGLEITVRCEWEGDSPNGVCFDLKGLSVEDDHSSGNDFLALDCDQTRMI